MNKTFIIKWYCIPFAAATCNGSIRKLLGNIANFLPKRLRSHKAKSLFPRATAAIKTVVPFMSLCCARVKAYFEFPLNNNSTLKVCPSPAATRAGFSPNTDTASCVAGASCCSKLKHYEEMTESAFVLLL